MISQDKIWKSPRLPSLPSVAIQVLELNKSIETTIADITSVVRSDPALSAKILKAANSPRYGAAREIGTLDHAISLLGRTNVTTLTLSFSLTDDAFEVGRMAEQYKRFWLQSLVQATTADEIAKQIKAPSDTDYFLTGLLLDVGQLAMLKAIPETYWQIYELAFDEGIPFCEIEQEGLGFDHIEIGTKMMESWGMPESIVAGISSHHKKSGEISADDPKVIPIAAFAAAVGEYFVSNRKGEALEHLQKIGEEHLELGAGRVEAFLQEIEQLTQDVGELMSIETDGLQSASDLMAIAMEQLAETAMSG